ncbi:uncharacterized protein LOC111067714 isoform X2 [Drosophila obscura]|uniref:uncharacterized protein LOC111067714 isoform X2 n=1 Tax=Drosophila obscura TaxID=7282 RepID=UPI001BB21352|nr:uncharacterized protein LOC111067714 isoform X2 [Drosophila obscura]
MNCKLRRLDMLRSGQLSDCEVRVWYSDRSSRCHRVFRCHQFLLVSASEEFGRLCRSPCFERNHRVIDLDDASPQAYEALILYIYTYEVCNAINLEMCGELMRLAMKHKMYDFIDCYLTKLSAQEWPMEVVLQIFHLANQHNSPVIMDLVAKKILPIATRVLNENVFLRLNVRELKALMIILKAEEIVPDSELLVALKKYQVANHLRYCDMERFQQFVEVARLFENVYFAVDGSLAIRRGANETKENDADQAEEQNNLDCACSPEQKEPNDLCCCGSNQLFVDCSPIELQEEAKQEKDPMARSSKQSNHSNHSNCSRVVLEQDGNMDCGCGVVQNLESCPSVVVQPENDPMVSGCGCGCGVVPQENATMASSSKQSNHSNGSRVVLKQNSNLDCGCGEVPQENATMASSSKQSNHPNGSRVVLKQNSNLDCGCGCGVVPQENATMASSSKQSNQSNGSRAVVKQNSNLDCGCGVVQKAEIGPRVVVKQENDRMASSSKQSNPSNGSKAVVKQDINIDCGCGACQKAENNSIVVVKQHYNLDCGCGPSSSIRSHSKGSRGGKSTSAGCGCGVDVEKQKPSKNDSR